MVTIDGSSPIYGIIGSATSTNDPKINFVKGTLEEQFRKRHPNAKKVAVVLQHIQSVSSEVYLKESENFLPII